MTTKQVQVEVVKAITDYAEEITAQYGDEMQSSITISSIQARVADEDVSQGQIVYAIRELVKDKKVERRGVKAPKYAMMGVE